MRVALSSLTTRGRAFVSSGITAMVCALALGLDDLARVGVLLLVLPLLSAAAVTRGRHRLGMARSVSPTRVAVGQPARVEIALSNEGRGPTGLLLLEEQLPYVLGARPRFVVDRMGAGWRRTVAYTVRSDVRGHYVLGPMTVRVNDPFGLVELDRTFHSTGSVVVTPRVVPLPAVPLAGVWTGSGDNRPRDFAGGSAEDVTVREYRRGDDLRRVHWRSSAHAGELMVRREEQPWQSRATVFVDNRRYAHVGSGPASSLEYAVTVAASVAMHLAQRGFQVRLATADSADSHHGWHEHGAASSEAGPLLEALAFLRESDRVELDASWLGEAQQSGLLVAVLGRAAPADRAVLGRMRHASSTPMAVVLDVDRWNPGRGAGLPSAGLPEAGLPDAGLPDAGLPDAGLPAAGLPAAGLRGPELSVRPSSVALMKAAGWRAVTAGPGDSLPGLWQQLGFMGRSRSHGAADPGGAAESSPATMSAPVPGAGGAA